jgi:hypothetical protein
VIARCCNLIVLFEPFFVFFLTLIEHILVPESQVSMVTETELFACVDVEQDPSANWSTFKSGD